MNLPSIPDGLRPAGRPLTPEALLTIALAGILLLLNVRGVVGHLILEYPFGVDLEIPLRAASRWVEGGEPYLASSFTSPPGPTQPFLYPPWVLPAVAWLIDLPRMGAKVAWLLCLLAAATWTCRRLRLSRTGSALFLTWPPFAEGLYAGNAQIVIFAAFCALFFSAGGASSIRTGTVTFLTAAIKPSQPHALVRVLIDSPRAVVFAAVCGAALFVATLPLVGWHLWMSWFTQLSRAMDPAWEMGGFALARFFPQLGALVVALSILAVPFVPRGGRGEAVGLLAVAGATSLQVFGLLFLIPALRRIRTPVALTAAIFVSTYSYEGMWAGALLCGGWFLLERRPVVAGRRIAYQRPLSESPSLLFRGGTP